MTTERRKPVLMQGNEAIAEGALAAGMRFFAGYPISPSSEVAENLARKLPQIGGTFIQMEDEIASISAIIGASIAGVKSMTATSGPGISLMQEGIGYGAMTETPCVIVNAQRMGPSSGFATAPAQADLMQAKYGTHGPHPAIALSPSSVRECFDVTVEAFNLAERYRTPVTILTDAVIGHLREVITLPDASELKVEDRRRPQGPPGTVKPFYTEGDIGIPAIPDFGTGYRFHITGLFHDDTGFPATSPAKLQHETERLVNKVEARADEMAHVEYFQMDDAELTVVSWGCSARSAKAAVRAARARGIKAGMVRLVTLWPLPERILLDVAQRTPRLVVAEMNLGELAGEIRRITRNDVTVAQANRHDGQLLTPGQVMSVIEGVLQHA